jgi:DNA polymerase-3 subunit delta
MNSQGGYVYILYGDDTFGRDEAVQTLKDRMRALPAGEHNLTELGPEATVAALRAAADVVPFLADRRMVIVYGLIGRLTGRGSGGQRRPPRGRKSAANDTGPDEYQVLLEYLPDLPQTTSLVLVEDGRLTLEPLVAVIPRGRSAVRGYPRVTDREVPGWLRGRAKLIGMDLDETAVRELASVGGGDLRRLDSELRKLADYADGRTVARADVRELVTGQEVDVWAMLDGLAERNAPKALAAFRALCNQGVPTGALFGRDIVPHYHRLLVARELSLATGAERARIDVAALGMNPATVGRWMDQAARFDRHELEHAMELLLDLDRQIKIGETEAEPSIEAAIVQLCTRLSPSAA